jgi:hypothetical protein
MNPDRYREPSRHEDMEPNYRLCRSCRCSMTHRERSLIPTNRVPATKVIIRFMKKLSTGEEASALTALLQDLREC